MTMIMNDYNNEMVRFSMKPNPFLYALEFTRHALLIGTEVGLAMGIPYIWPGVYSQEAVVLLLIAYFLLGLVLFFVAFAAAGDLMFIVTDKRAIVRCSSTAEAVSIAIETVRRIEITSFGATFGSVYLTCDKPSPRGNSTAKNSRDNETAYEEATGASMPIKRTNSIVVLTNNWPRLFGFYGFKGFDGFANIVSKK
jgi:hypothetical protein